MASTISRTSLRKQTRRNRTSYRELDSDSANDTDLELRPARRTLPSRAARADRSIFARDDTTEESSSSSDDEAPARRPPTRSQAPVLAVPVTRSAGTKRKLPSRSVAPSHHKPFANFKRRKTLHAAPSKKFLTPIVNVPLPPRGRIPPWQTLPYHVLLSIMQHASYPLYIGASTDTGSTRWLLNTSELCTSFHDACIGALMSSPPTFPAHRAHFLVNLLRASARHDHEPGPSDTAESDKAKLSLDYRPKVKSLYIEVKQLLVKKSGIDLNELLRYTPRLKKLRLYHNHDIYSKRYIWALPENARNKGQWSYGNTFDLLDENNIVLDSFEWNGRFLWTNTLLSSLAAVSVGSRSLQQLRALAIRNLSLPDIASSNEALAKNSLTTENEALGTIRKPVRLLHWRQNLLHAIKASSQLRDLSFFDCNILDDATLQELPSTLQTLEISGCAWIKSDGLQQYLETKGRHLTTLTLEGNQSLSLGFMHDLQKTAPNLQMLEVDLTYHDPTSYKDTEPLFDELLPNGPPTWPAALQTINIGPLRNLNSEDAESFYQSLVDASNDLPFLRVLELRTIIKESWRSRAAMRQKWASLLLETFSIDYNSDYVPASAPTSDSERSSRKSSRLSHVPAKQGHGRCHTVIFDLSDQRPAQDQFTEGDFLDDELEDDGEWNGVDVDLPTYSARKYAW